MPRMIACLIIRKIRGWLIAAMEIILHTNEKNIV
jgi:hypothetical protein